MSGLLSLLHPAAHSTYSATSILHNALRSTANDHSASPLIRLLSTTERQLRQLMTAEEGPADEWQVKVREQLVAVCEVLQQIDPSTVARPLSELFPELDGLLLSLLHRLGGSVACQSLLLASGGLLVRAARSTGAVAWPRWLLSSTVPSYGQ